MHMQSIYVRCTGVLLQMTCICAVGPESACYVINYASVASVEWTTQQEAVLSLSAVAAAAAAGQRAVVVV